MVLDVLGGGSAEGCGGWNWQAGGRVEEQRGVFWMEDAEFMG